MPNLKPTKKYYFTVEGETEYWYLSWLKDKINKHPAAKFKVSFNSKVEKNPIKRAKSINVLSKTEITHVFDYERNDAVHIAQFIETVDKLKKTMKLGKDITYNSGYCNFAFELWIVLHKMDCNGPLDHRRQYLDPINRAYNEQFENLDQYKHEANFKRVLSKITLAEMNFAIERSKLIMYRNQQNIFTLQQYKGFEYYRENPSLLIWQSIEKIMTACNI